jgi:phospholipase/carboxylesterase
MTDEDRTGQPGEDPGRLTFRARPSRGNPGGRDVPLGLGGDRDGVLYVPETAGRGAPVIVVLHGAGGTGRRVLRPVLGAADHYGAVVVAPDSRLPTWDIIAMQAFGPDVAFVDQALNVVADTCDVNFDRLAISGISDGASYALSLGLTNGDLFPAIVAFSPGFFVAAEVRAKPRVFISHGTNDQVLPIDQCGRRLAAHLDMDGYAVTFHEFDGGHAVPPDVADLGFQWWVDG